MSILFRAQIVFHSQHGFSLDVREIDPKYSLGDMARRRREILDRLDAEGLLDKNKALPRVLVPQRIAVISSDKAAGLEDFLYRLANNPYKFAFFPVLFPATVQGEGAEPSLLSALERVSAEVSRFDCVVLIRGGGSVTDLSCFDSYALARAISNCPLPVIVGIGHQKDRTVCDEVAAKSVPTPTAAAELLVTRLKSFDDVLENLSYRLDACTQKTVQAQFATVESLSNRFVAAARREVSQEQANVESVAQRMASRARSSVEASSLALTELAAALKIHPCLVLERESTSLKVTTRDLSLATHQSLHRVANELSQVEKDVRQMDPAEVLRRGFSITRFNGRAIRDPHEAPVGASVETMVFGGRFESTVNGTIERLETPK